MGSQLVERLMPVQVEPACHAGNDHQGRDETASQNPAEQPPARAGRRHRLPVVVHRVPSRGRQRLATIAAEGRAATHPSLQRRPHTVRTELSRPGCDDDLSDTRLGMERLFDLACQAMRVGKSRLRVDENRQEYHDSSIGVQQLEIADFDTALLVDFAM